MLHRSSARAARALLHVSTGPTPLLSYPAAPDLAAAAHISVADYLGGIDWRAHENTRVWYMGLKSRPSFRPLLAERMGGIAPPTDYDKVDF
jgi:glutathione S-transferase